MSELSIRDIVVSKGLSVKLHDDGTFGSYFLTKMSKAFIPDEARLDKINKVALGTLVKEDVVVVTIRAAGSKIDRGLDKFELKALQKMAAKAIENELPILLASEYDKKDHTAKGINQYGTVFDAYVKDGELFYEAYFAKTQKNGPVLEMIIAGHYKKGSVSFSMSHEDYLCSKCNLPIVSKDCPHQPGEDDVFTKIADVIDNYEYSLVAIPMQAESAVVGVAMSLDNSNDDRINIDTIEDNNLMSEEKKDETEVVAATTPEVETKEAEVEAVVDVNSEILNALKALVEGIKSLDSKIDGLKPVEKAVEVETPVSTEEVVEPAKSVVEAEEKSVELPVSKKAQEPLEARLEQTPVVKKSAELALFERLTLPNE